MTEHPDRDAVLTAGLRWLYETEQPDDSRQSHHGALIPANSNRTYTFAPVSARQLPVIIVDVARVEWIDNGPNDLQTPANPLETLELDALAAELERRGYPIEGTWNGHPGVTGSVGLARPAHSSLFASVQRYRAGCLEHPERSVFCDCRAWLDGFSRVVQPMVAPAVPAA